MADASLQIFGRFLTAGIWAPESQLHVADQMYSKNAFALTSLLGLEQKKMMTRVTQRGWVLGATCLGQIRACFQRAAHLKVWIFDVKMRKEHFRTCQTGGISFFVLSDADSRTFCDMTLKSMVD